MVRELLTMAVMLGAGAAAAADDLPADDPLAAYRWKARVVVLTAANADDARLARQRLEFAAVRNGLRERDVVVIEAVGDQGAAKRLRARLALPDAEFRAVLVGKDGTVKRSDDRPVSADTLFATIDAMPMRRDEVRR